MNTCHPDSHPAGVMIIAGCLLAACFGLPLSVAQAAVTELAAPSRIPHALVPATTLHPDRAPGTVLARAGGARPHGGAAVRHRPPAARPGVRPGPRPGARPGARPPARRPVVVAPGHRPVVVAPGGAWRRPASYWWRPGGAIAAGAAVGFLGAAAAASYAGAPPAPGYCWYYTNPQRTQGFWDQCP